MEIKKFTELYIDATKEGKKIPKEQYQKTGNYPIIDQGQQEIDGWCDDEEGSFKNVPAILFGDHTRIIKYVEEPFFIGADGVKILCPVNKKDNIKYLYYALQAARIPNLGYSRHFKVVKELNIFTYEKSIQDKIVCVLEKIDSIIMQQKRRLNYLEELVKSRFIEMFGDLANLECSWNKNKLIEVCTDKEDIKCGPFGTQLSKEEYVESGIAVWEIPQINTAFSTKPIHFLTKEKAEQLKAYTIISGDIAMSRKGNVGKCALFPDDYPDGIIHSDVLRIRVDCKRVNSLFMMYQLHFSGAVTRQIELVSSGAIMAGVNVTKLKQIYVHVPPIELQNQFADFVAQTDKSKYYNFTSYKYCVLAAKLIRQEWMLCQTLSF